MSIDDTLPATNSEYESKAYWDSRYQINAEKEESFDWFKDYTSLEHKFSALIPRKQSRILMLGCGNSLLSEQMYDAGYENIVNVDFSEPVIEHMQAKCSNRTKMTWLVMNICELKFDPESFDVVIDKGTMDALLCGSTSVWDPPESVKKACNAEVSNVVRVLKSGGVFIYVTFGQPHFRKMFLSRPDHWFLTVDTIGDAFHYFIYSMVKH